MPLRVFECTSGVLAHGRVVVVGVPGDLLGRSRNRTQNDYRVTGFVKRESMGKTSLDPYGQEKI